MGYTQFISIKLVLERVVCYRIGKATQRQIAGVLTSQRGHVNRAGQRPVRFTIKDDVSIRGISNEELVRPLGQTVKILGGETLPERTNFVASGEAYDEVFGVPWCAAWWHR